MRGFPMNREGAAAMIALPTSAAIKINEPVTLLNAALWTIQINGQITTITLSDLLAIIGGLVGVIALALSIVKHFKAK